MFRIVSAASGVLLVCIGFRSAVADSCTSCHAAIGAKSKATSIASKLANSHAKVASYSLTVSENLEVLKNPGDPAVEWMAAWTTPAELMQQRNKPYFMLENTSTKQNGGTGAAQLTKFILSIGDTSQNFDWLKVITDFTSPGVKLVKMEGVDKVEGKTQSDQIALYFSGFTPGKRIVFQVDIDPDKAKGNPLTDYRQVLFSLNGGPDASGNAQTSASFLDKTLALGSQEFSLAESSWQNPHFDKQTFFGMQPQVQYMGDNVTSFETHNFVIKPVPEPGGFALAAITSGAIALVYWRKGGWRTRSKPSA